MDKPICHTILHTANNELKIGDRASWCGIEDVLSHHKDYK
jgi:hypothetical protein